MVQLSTHRKFCRRTRAAERRKRNQKIKTKNRTCRNRADGFLNHEFLPVLINPADGIKAWQKIENDFFNSLNNLSALYGFELLNVKGKVFPYNIALSFAHAQACMKELQPDLSLVIIQDKFHCATVATVKTFNTRMTLYFIDVKPFYELLQGKKRKHAAGLLQSVFTYLHKVVGIPYYMDTRTYIYYCYENISNWLMNESDELDQEQFEEDLANLDLCFFAGRTVHKKIQKANQLNLLKRRNKNFEPACKWEKELLMISKRVQIMMEEFGETSINDMIFERLLEPDEDNRVYPEHYISFVYDDGGWINENIIEQVNNELQEISVMEEPSSIQFFDKPQQAESHNLSFPIRLFDLINDLCDLLNSYKP
jgi:hypothetical protein